MAKTPQKRTTCPVCRRDVAVSKNGSIAKHGGGRSAEVRCSGSGRPLKAK